MRTTKLWAVTQPYDLPSVMIFSGNPESAIKLWLAEDKRQSSHKAWGNDENHWAFAQKQGFAVRLFTITETEITSFEDYEKQQYTDYYALKASQSLDEAKAIIINSDLSDEDKGKLIKEMVLELLQDFKIV